MSHRPLSQELADFLATPEGTDHVTINRLIEKTDGRGIYLMIVLLNLPFITPVPMMGLSTVFGLVTVLLCLRMLSNKPPKLPEKFGNREIPLALRNLIAKGGVKVLSKIEKVVRPRKTAWMAWRITRVVHALLMVVMCLLLMLPLPIPLTNSFPAISLILIAVSMMEEDGLAIFVAYAMVLLTIGFFITLSGTIIAVFLKVWERVEPYFAVMV